MEGSGLPKLIIPQKCLPPPQSISVPVLSPSGMFSPRKGSWGRRLLALSEPSSFQKNKHGAWEN